MLSVLLLPFAAEALAAAHTRVILAFGDSLVAGLGVPPEAAFPAQLEARLNAQGNAIRVVNAGVSGDTTAGGLARIDRALADKPDIVLLELGANDALRGIQPAIVRANLDAIITKIQQSGAKLVITGMLAPPNWGEEYRRAFDRVYPELARAHAVPLYPFFLEGVALNRQLNQPDGLHPNERGVTVLIDHIADLFLHDNTAETATLVEAKNIQVLTDKGIVSMTPAQYEQRTRQVGHLPVMSASYIFGHTVPMPTTDKNGHIHISNTGHTSEEQAERGAQPASRDPASSAPTPQQ
jgi:acyl-CoA thioesterase-1